MKWTIQYLQEKMEQKAKVKEQNVECCISKELNSVNEIQQISSVQIRKKENTVTLTTQDI
jgi:Uri superfamily endonuclease